MHTSSDPRSVGRNSEASERRAVRTNGEEEEKEGDGQWRPMTGGDGWHGRRRLGTIYGRGPPPSSALQSRPITALCFSLYFIVYGTLYLTHANIYIHNLYILYPKFFSLFLIQVQCMATIYVYVYTKSTHKFMVVLINTKQCTNNKHKTGPLIMAPH